MKPTQFGVTAASAAFVLMIQAMGIASAAPVHPQPLPRPEPTFTTVPGPRPSESPRPRPSDSPRPRPTPSESPTPVVTPSPTPTVIVIDTGPARREGAEDGRRDGDREGDVRGPAEGTHQGEEIGFREGFARCEAEERQRAYDFGYREGFEYGERQGADAGRSQGFANGQSKGSEDGREDGINRADGDANRTATPQGAAKGIEQANQSDASQRGTVDGSAQGDRDAAAEALAEDYPRGRSDYRSGRYSEAIESEDAFSQIGSRPVRAEGSAGLLGNFWQGLRARALNFDRGHGARPDRRFYNPRPHFPTAQENQAYNHAYAEAYDDGFDRSYDRQFRIAFERAKDRAMDDGCRSARGRDYRADRRRGEEEGRSVGYQRAYDVTYRTAYQRAYDDAFASTTVAAYNDHYSRAFQHYFENARASAYASRVDALYRAAFRSARDAKFAEMYPVYAGQQYRRGQADEAADFEARPVRLIGGEVVESIQNGVFEPGEPLRLTVRFRNFATAEAAGRDVKVQLIALDSNSAVIGVAESVLSKNLKRKSMTLVSDLLEFRMQESVVNRTTSFRLVTMFRGRSIGEQTLQVATRFLVSLGFAEPPMLSEGMESVLRVSVKNEGNVPTDAGLTVRMRTDSDAIEITSGQAGVGVLAPGASRVVEFKAIARKGGQPVIPIALEATTGGGRRVGLVDQMREVPVINDYTINLLSSAQGLRKAGLYRLEYVVQNANSRAVLQSLQLKIAVKSDMADSFAIVGPNPQFLNPLIRGQATKFVIPVLVKNDNSGGTLELEVQEAGKTVVVHQLDF